MDGALVGFIVTALMGAAFLLLAVRFWQGKWLRLIAGNNFVTEGEMDTPYQRGLGRRTALVAAAAAVMSFAISALALGEGLGNETLRLGGMVVCALAVAALLISIVYLQAWAMRCAKAQREQRLRQARQAGSAAAAAAESDAKLDKRQTAIIIAIILCVTALTLAIGFLPRT